MRARQRPTSALARSVALGTVLIFALSGCGGGATPTEVPEAGAGVSTEEGASEAEESDSGPADAMVTPRPGMVDVEPVEIWHEYGIWEDDLMYVTFPSQGEPCQVLDRIEVDETETRVVVTLYQGRDPDIDPDEPCDGPSRVLGVVLPPFERDHGSEGGAFVNGADLIDRP